MAHVAKFYSRLWLICSVGEHQNFQCLKLIEIVILWVYYNIPFWLRLVFRQFRGIDFQLLVNHLLTSLFELRIIDEVSVHGMRIWFILLIKSDLKWCIHLSRGQKKSTEGCSKFKSLETRQVQERLFSTLYHMQVPKWDRTRCPE